MLRKVMLERTHLDQKTRYPTIRSVHANLLWDLGKVPYAAAHSWKKKSRSWLPLSMLIGSRGARCR